MTIKQQIENARLEIDTWSSEKLTNVQLEGTLHQKSERVLKEHFLWNVDMKIELWFDYDGHTYTPVVDTTGYIQKSAIHVLNTNRKMFLLDKN